MKRLFFLIAAVSMTVLTACTDDDSFSTSRSDTLSFSQDTVSLDTIFSTVPTSTRSFMVYNRNDDGLRIRQVRLRRGNQTGFRVNVDGEYLDNSLGSQISNVEVRGGDSIRVFVELTSAENKADEPQLVEDDLLFVLESGVEQGVCLRAYSWDALFCDSLVIRRDTVISTVKPIVVRRGITVDEGATLTINYPSALYFSAGAGLDVYGRLIVNSDAAGQDVVFRGDRTDRMFDYLPYDRVSGQWMGIRIHPSSTGNSIRNADIHSSEYGIMCDSTGRSTDEYRLMLENVTIHNCKGSGLSAYNSNIFMSNCQITNTLGNCVDICGGSTLMVYCTIAQFYPFSSERGAALHFANFSKDYDYPLDMFECYNSLITGYAKDVIFGEVKDSTVAFNYYFSNSILRTEKPDSANLESGAYNNVIWETAKDTVQGKAHFVMIDEDNLRYDFRLDSLSTARGAALPLMDFRTDRNGRPRGDAPDIGCYQFVAPEPTGVRRK